MDERIGYVVADTWAGRHCHAVDVIGETPKMFRVRFRSQVCARVPAGYVQLLKKDRVMFTKPTWAVGEKMAQE